MTLNTFVAGNPGEARSFAQELRKFGEHTETAATGAHQSHTRAAGEWEGAASETFQGWAKQQGTDGDALAEVAPAVARVHDTLADELDTVKARMEQAKQVARDGGLKLMGAHLILPPKAPSASKPEPPKGRMNAAQAEQHSQDVAAYEAAMAEHQRQQAAWNEVKSTVTAAREKEKAAHEAFVNALDKTKAQLKGIGQAQKWAQAGVQPASAAAGGLAQAATAMESSAAEATKSMFERSLSSPAAVNAAWSVMTSAQRNELIDRHPKLVGSTDGVPAVARGQANRSLLTSERQRIKNRLGNIREALKLGSSKDPHTRQLIDESQQLSDALGAIDKLENDLNTGDKYLLGFAPAESEGRGQAIVANGNPDKADHVMTYVPGTTSDIGSLQGDMENTQVIHERAQQMAGDEKVATITWNGYEAPLHLPAAVSNDYAVNATDDLSSFQEGLRATHEGEPSHNTVLGHSYGTTAIGYTAQEQGVHADDIAFLGSPGVGPDHARELGVPPEHVWAGKSESDSINAAGPPGFIDTWDGVDNQWFGNHPLDLGVAPSDPSFGGNQIPSDPNTAHTEYFEDKKAMDGVARIVSGRAEGQG